MSPGIADELTQSAARLEQLRWRIEALTGGAPVSRVAHELHDALTTELARSAQTFADLARHPLGPKASWTDMPQFSTNPIKAVEAKGGPWHGKRY